MTEAAGQESVAGRVCCAGVGEPPPAPPLVWGAVGRDALSPAPLYSRERRSARRHRPAGQNFYENTSLITCFYINDLLDFVVMFCGNVLW